MVLIEPIILFLAVIAVLIIYLFLKVAKHLIINTVLGLILLFVANFVFQLGINIKNVWVILVCAIGGIPGAILVILLHILHLAF